MPLITLEKIPVIAGIKRSSSLLVETWGAPIKINFQLGCLLVLIRLIALIPMIVGLILGGHNSIIIGSAITALAFNFATVLNSGSQATLCCSLYLYAKGEKPTGFVETDLKSAFKQ